MTTHLHIEHLVVDGLSLGPHGPADLQAALQQQLEHLLGEKAVPLPDGTHPSLPLVICPAFAAPTGADCAALGARIAASVHGGLTTLGPAVPDPADAVSRASVRGRPMRWPI